jgi:hypothetical protein
MRNYPGRTLEEFDQIIKSGDHSGPFFCWRPLPQQLRGQPQGKLWKDHHQRQHH